MGGVFPKTHDSRQLVPVAGAYLSPRLWTPHPSDPAALVWTPAFRPMASDALRGLFALKVASHTAHHRFGRLGRLPHLQVNTWRVGVKGSGSAMRLPLGPTLLLRALLLVSQLR